MERAIISWNATNWITVVLMVAGAWFIARTGIMVFKKASGNA